MMQIIAMTAKRIRKILGERKMRRRRKKIVE
jgi:hypothetical protein